MKRTISDVVIIGAGMGGSTAALTLAPTGANILILEQGSQIKSELLTRDTKAIFQKDAYTPKEKWFGTAGNPPVAGTYANFGGSSKFYGGLLARFRGDRLRGPHAAWQRRPCLADPVCRRL